MSSTLPRSPDDIEFYRKVEYEIAEKTKDFFKSLNIAVIGKVSSGKSSLINAFLRRNRHNPVAKVGAESGITKKLQFIPLSERIYIVDSPGLEDVRQENSKITQAFLSHIDVGILVVCGSSDATQKTYVDELKKYCDRVFVVLNKIDEYDKLERSALDKVIAQWKSDLQVQKIYPVCTFGYDPETCPDLPLDIRGVDILREDIEDFLASEGKDILLARVMGEKRPFAVKIIAGTSCLVAASAFVPGSGILITTLQAVAICQLYYLYKGKVISATSVFATMTAFTMEAAGKTLFIWISSIFPPSGIVDSVTAVISISLTLSTLLAVNSILSRGAELDEKQLIQSEFRKFQQRAKDSLGKFSKQDLINRNIFMEIVDGLIE
ncbi:GTPase Der [Planktothrix agardhii]|uniref:GTPase n=1 Tax=Planktothrix agardhii TaxID=1160 RepID=UPI0020A6F826|nr:GTPase [Planktothrix agardhii]CAD5930375.1 GTPase Der [Planktothrix agardhii]